MKYTEDHAPQVATASSTRARKFIRCGDEGIRGFEMTPLAVYFHLVATHALWSGTIKNPDVSTGPLACPFARTGHSHARGKVNDLMSQNGVVLSHSVTLRTSSGRSEDSVISLFEAHPEKTGGGSQHPTSESKKRTKSQVNAPTEGKTR